jgi:hypothetical protein
MGVVGHKVERKPVSHYITQQDSCTLAYSTKQAVTSLTKRRER